MKILLKVDEHEIGTFNTVEEAYQALRNAVIGRYVKDIFYSRMWKKDDKTTVVDFGSWAHFGYLTEIEE